jgi:hypothetical protein
MNRGQLAKLFSTIPVLLFLVLFMGLFVFLASGTGIFRETTRGPSYVPAGASLLSEQVVYAGNTYSVLDLVMRSYFDKRLEQGTLDVLTPFAQRYFVEQASGKWDWWTGYLESHHPCMIVSIDETSAGRDGIRYVFIKGVSGNLQSCITYDEDVSVGYRFRECDRNYMRPVQAYSRVFVDRANQRFELVAYQGACIDATGSVSRSV